MWTLDDSNTIGNKQGLNVSNREDHAASMTTRAFFTAVLFSTLFVSLASLSFAGPAVDLAARGEQLMQDGNYPKAAEACEKFLREYPTGGDGGPDLVFKVRYNLAWCYYLNQEYLKAIKAFQDLAGDKSPSPELKEQALQLVGDSYSRYAGALQDPKEKKDNYTKAIDTYTKFIGGFPNSASMPDVLYGRGLAYFRVEKYDEAEKDLQTQLEKFPLSDLKLDSQYLLATVLGTHGAALQKDNKTDQAKKYLESSRDRFKEIIASSDIALANDAAYAAGEIFIQLGEYDTAIFYYRSVRRQDEVVASQEAKLDRISKALGAALASGDKRRVEGLRNLRMKESSKLKEIKSSPDLLLAADMRIADCYFRQKKYAEARVMYGFLLPHAELGDREVAKQAASQVVATYIGELRPVPAKEAFEKFDKDFPKDPLAESFGLAIGDQFLRKGKAEEALAQLDKSLQDFPKGQYVPLVQFRRAMALDALQRSDEAAKQMEGVINSADLKNLADEVEYALGKMLKNQRKFDEAIKHLKTVEEKNPKFELLDDVNFQIALCYKGKKEYDKAVEMLRKFIQTYEPKQSTLVVPALYQIGQCYEEKDDIDNAIKTYREVVSKYSSHKLAPFAQYQIAIVYYNKTKWKEMVDAFEELVKKFPNDTLVCDAHFWIGFKFQQEKDYPKAVERFEKVVKDCHDNPIAPDAQYRIGNCWQNALFAMGKYKAQEKDKQPVWKDLMAKAEAAYEKILSDYPKSTQLDATLEGLIQLALAKLQAEVASHAEVDAYFTKLSGQYSADPQLAAKVLFCLASVYYEIRKPEDAIRIFAKAFEGAGDAPLPGKYYEQYGNLLTESKKCEEAEGIYLKMQERFKEDPQTLANAVWGLGNLYLQCGAYEKAIAEFDRLIKDFPWHPRGADAQFGKGLVLESQKQYDAAAKIYDEVAVKLKGTARIRSLLGLGRCQMAKGDCASAIKNFEKVSMFYEKEAEFSCEALWLAGQCYEKLAAGNPTDRPKNIQNAIDAYRDLLKKYPNCKFADDAKKRLSELAPSK